MINIFVYSFSLEWDRPFELTFYVDLPTNPPGRLYLPGAACWAGPRDSEVNESPASAPHQPQRGCSEGAWQWQEHKKRI